MRAPDRPLLGPVPAVGDDPGAAIRAARLEEGYTLAQLADEVLRVRQQRGWPEIQHESVRRQLIAFERGQHVPGPQWRPLLAAALRRPQEQLFGLTVSPSLPRPLLADLHVTDATVGNLLNRRALYAETEHIFGPLHVHQQVARDMQVVEELLKTTPARLRRNMRLAAASFAELLGWLAQDTGNGQQARRYTDQALAHLAVLDGVDPALRAMLMMRRSNIVTTSEPQTAIEYADAAAALVDGLPSSRLHASIARQRALAAVAAGEEPDFVEHMAYAFDLSHADRTGNDLAAYVTPAYIASETATGLIKLRRADEAVDKLLTHLDQWPDGQQRDQAVAHWRLIRALIVTGDYSMALLRLDEALRRWRATPSARARHEMSLLANVLRRRSRGRAGSSSLPLNQLRGRLKDALQGGPEDG